MKCPYSELFWSVFSRIRNEYGKIRTRITPNTDTFYVVSSDSISSEACNFIKKRLQCTCFPVNVEKMFKNIYFEEHLRAAASVNTAH